MGKTREQKQLDRAHAEASKLHMQCSDWASKCGRQEKQIDRLEKQLKDQSELIDQLVAAAREQRDVQRDVIVQLLDRYDVVDPRRGAWIYADTEKAPR